MHPGLQPLDRPAPTSYRHYDFIYGCRAILLSKSGQLESARAAIHEGLDRSRSKHTLREDLGNIEFEWGNVAGVATALGEEPASASLLAAVDRQWLEKVRLNGKGRGRVALRVAPSIPRSTPALFSSNPHSG